MHHHHWEAGENEMLTLNQRLDQMAPNNIPGYRGVCGLLARALAIMEDAASSDPPNMPPERLDVVCKDVAEALEELRRIQTGQVIDHGATNITELLESRQQQKIYRLGHQVAKLQITIAVLAILILALVLRTLGWV